RPAAERWAERAPGALPPDAEGAPDSDELSEVVRVVIDDEQDRSQVGLVASSRGDRGEQIDRGIANELNQPAAVALEVGDARFPRGLVRDGRRRRPVVVRPRERVFVPWIRAEVEQILLCPAHVLEELPRRVVEAGGTPPAAVGREALDGPVEGDVGFLPFERPDEMRSERVCCGRHGVEPDSPGDYGSGAGRLELPMR